MVLIAFLFDPCRFADRIFRCTLVGDDGGFVTRIISPKESLRVNVSEVSRTDVGARVLEKSARL